MSRGCPENTQQPAEAVGIIARTREVALATLQEVARVGDAEEGVEPSQELGRVGQLVQERRDQGSGEGVHGWYRARDSNPQGVASSGF